MKYVVLTTKHHEGFCLWDSALTDYNVTNTPFGKDLVGAVRRALRAEGLKVGFYHSLIDWHHPDFAVDGLHPLRDDADVPALNDGRDMARYREYLHGQVRELLTELRQDRLPLLRLLLRRAARSPSICNGKGADDWGSTELLAMVRELQPGIIVNDRLDIPGDFVTPEQYQPSGPMTVDGEPVPWEACQTLNGSWGYDRDNLDYKSAGPAGPDARRRGRQGRQHAAQRRPHRPRRLRPAGRRDPGGHRRLDAAARPLDLRRRPVRVHRPRRTPATRSAATGSTCTCSPGRSSTSTCRAWPARSSTPSCSTTLPRSASSMPTGRGAGRTPPGRPAGGHPDPDAAGPAPATSRCRSSSSS